MIDLKELPKSFRTIAYYITDILSGSLLIIIIYYVFAGDVYSNFGENIIVVINYISKDAFKFIIFIIAAWPMGFIIYNLISMMPISKSRKLFDTSSKIKREKHISALSILNKEEFEGLKWRFNSLLLRSHISCALGATFFISALLFLIAFLMNFKIADLLLFFTFIFFVLSCEIYNRKQISRLDGLTKWIANQYGNA